MPCRAACRSRTAGYEIFFSLADFAASKSATFSSRLIIARWNPLTYSTAETSAVITTTHIAPRPSVTPSLYANPGTLLFYVDPYNAWRKMKAQSEHTLKRDTSTLVRFIRFCEERGVSSPQEVTRAFRIKPSY